MNRTLSRHAPGWLLFLGLALAGPALGASPQPVERDALPAEEPIPRMVSPSLDRPDEPFSYAALPTDQIGVMYSPAGTEVTPQGSLYTGYGELMFYVGIEREPVSARIRTLEDGYLPILSYAVAHDGLEYKFTMFAASLGPRQDGGRVVNWIRVAIRNPGKALQHGFLTSAWRYQAAQTTPFPTGDNRFQRPVRAARAGDYNQPGARFDPQASYTATRDAYLQNGKAIYFFPAEPKPELRPTLHDYYNRMETPGDKLSITPQTPVATVEYDVPVPPGETRHLDFKMPLAPVAENDPEFQAIATASFRDRRQQVREYWSSLVDRGIDIETPEEKVNQTFKTSLVNDLLALNKIGNQYVQTVNQLQYHAFYLRDSADIVRMYDLSGYPELAGRVVDFFATRQQPDGNFLSQRGQYDGWGEALWTYGEHYRMTHDRAFAESVYPRVVRAVDWLEKAVAADPLHIMPATDVRDNEYVAGHLTGYNFLALDGLDAARGLAADLGHTQDEARFGRIEDGLRRAFMQRLDAVTGETGGYIPPTLNGGREGTDWGNLLALVPEEQLNPFDPRVTATLKNTQKRYQEGLITYSQPNEGVFLHHYLTIKNTLTEVIRGEQEQAIRELYAVLVHTSSTNAGFEYSIRPWGDRSFWGNLAPHGWMAAEYRILLRDMMVREQGDSLHLLSAVSPSWVGAGKTISVERAATYFGEVSFRLTMPDDSSADLQLSIPWNGAHAPHKVLVHLPWFVDASTASAAAGGHSLKIVSGAVTIPHGTNEVHFTWARRPLPAAYPGSYGAAVQQYENEYRKRFEERTGDRDPADLH